MKTKIHSQSGFFNPRILPAFVLGSVGVLLAMLSFAANPPRGMKTPSASSAGASDFVDNHAVPLKGNGAVPASSTPLAPTGLAWSIVTSPNTSATQENVLSGVTCTSASDCWAVGNYLTDNFYYQTLIEHWNGAAWSIVTSPNTSTTQDNSLSGVTCTSASDCWAVGDYVIPNGNGFYYSTLVEHWNGAAWSIIPSPNASTRQDNQLRGVTCTSASDCWAVGQYNTDFSSPHTLVEHWNGAAWSIVTSPNNATSENYVENYLSGVTCASASDCWAVGYYFGENAYQTLIERYSSIVPFDFNSDGKTDYVLQNVNTHQTALWYLNNNTFLRGASGPTLPAGWSLVDVADFNGGGKPDYALFNPTTHQTAIWYMNNSALIGGAYGPTLPAGWSLVATGDFNNDSKPDYVLYNASTRQTAIWYLNNNLLVGGAFGPTLPAGWSLVGVADFNHDGHTDYALFNSGTGQTAIWYLSGPTLLGGAFGPSVPSGWTLVGTADFNRDGNPDYVLYKANTRQTAIWYINNNLLVGGAYGPTLPSGWSLAAP
jgi:hypothetical protein